MIASTEEKKGTTSTDGAVSATAKKEPRCLGVLAEFTSPQELMEI